MTSSATVVEPTTLLRDWLRTLGLSVGARVYAGGLPQDPELPAVVLWRVGGGLVGSSEAPVDSGLYQFDCVATSAAVAAALAGELETALFVNRYPVALSANVRLTGVGQITGLPMNDPDPDFNRYLVSAQVVTISTPPS